MTIRMYDLAGKDPNRRFSPYCWRIRMALAHKGLAVETIPWRFVETDALAFSGSKTVPVLIDGDRTVADSWKIALYLEERYADRPALFGNEAARGATLFLRQWTERIVHPAVLRVVLMDIHACLDEANQAYFRTSREKRFGVSLEAFCADREGSIAKLREALVPARAVVSDQPFFGGATPSFADYILFGTFQWARCVSPAKLLAEDDALHAWRGRMLGLYDGLAAQAVGYAV